MKTLPFKIDRQKKSPLIEQIVNGVIAAVRSGYYQPGDKLPTMLEMHEELQVSMMVIRHAIKRLGERSFVEVKKNTGIKIADTDTENMSGNILFISPGGNVSYYFAARNHAFMKQLREARIHVTVLNIFESREKDRFNIVQHYLDIHPIDLVLIEGNPWDVDAFLHERRVPIIHVFSEHASEYADDLMSLDFSNAYRRIAKHCTSCGVSSIKGHICSELDRQALMAAFAGSDIALDFFEVPDSISTEAANSIEVPSERIGYDTMSALLKEECRPDLILSMDDYRTRGIVMACLENGVRIPKDIQLISQVNIGHAPVLGMPFSRIEMDPELNGVKMAELVLRNIKKNRYNYLPITIQPKFIVGKTTRRLK